MLDTRSIRLYSRTTSCFLVDTGLRLGVAMWLLWKNVDLKFSSLIRSPHLTQFPAPTFQAALLEVFAALRVAAETAPVEVGSSRIDATSMRASDFLLSGCV